VRVICVQKPARSEVKRHDDVPLMKVDKRERLKVDSQQQQQLSNNNSSLRAGAKQRAADVANIDPADTLLDSANKADSRLEDQHRQRHAGVMNKHEGVKVQRRLDLLSNDAARVSNSSLRHVDSAL